MQGLHAKSREHGTYRWAPMARDPDLGLGIGEPGASGPAAAGQIFQGSLVIFEIMLYRDNAISIDVICFEDSGQQKNGTARRVSGHAPTHVKVGQPPTKPQAGLMSCKFHVLCDAAGDIVSPLQLDVICGISAQTKKELHTKNTLICKIVTFRTSERTGLY
jgi:hypothetical protein